MIAESARQGLKWSNAQPATTTTTTLGEYHMSATIVNVDSNEFITEPRCLTAALQYAAEGFKVLPAEGKNPGGYIGTVWEAQASSDPEVINAWWAKWPKANVALFMGEDWLALDVDPRAGGDKAFAYMTDKYGELPTTRRHLSGRGDGGGHYVFKQNLFKHMGDVWDPIPAAEIADGLSLFTGNHVVIAPPSIHPDTKRPYTLVGTVAPVRAPEWLGELAARAKARKAQKNNANVTAHQHDFTDGQPGTAYGLEGLRRELVKVRQVWDENKEPFNNNLNNSVLAVSQLVHGGELEWWHAELEFNNLLAELGAPDDQYRTVRLIEASKAKPRVCSENQHGVNGVVVPTERRNKLEFEDVGDVAARVRGVTREYLIEDILIEKSYGPMGAEAKAGKTWLVADMAISVASGTPFLGRFRTKQGPVCVFVGEGDEWETIRRYDSVCASKGIDLDDLPIRLCHRAPKLTDSQHLELMKQELTAHRPVLTVIDPMYLSQGNVNGKNLADMGTMLAEPQYLCQDVGSALIAVCHWNKTGNGNGADRMTGVGMQEWGRVLISVAVKKRYEASLADRTGRTTVDLEINLLGQVDGKFQVSRDVWTDDRHDLNSEMYYEITHQDQFDQPDTAESGLGKNERKLFLAVARAGARASSGSIAKIYNEGMSKPVSDRSIRRNLLALEAKDGGRWLASTPGVGTEKLWTVRPTGEIEA